MLHGITGLKLASVMWLAQCCRRDVTDESLMITGDENIVDIDFVVFWQISDAGEYLFIG